MTAVAIFVKTPGLSPVKSRLAADIGQALATQCHLRCARAVAAVARASTIGPVYWAVAEDESTTHAIWHDLPRLAQGSGGLGARMQRVHDSLVQAHGSGLLIGADLPQLTVGMLHQAASHLAPGPARAVLGPARDGGFWLVGGNVLFGEACWSAPAYGGADVRRCFLDASPDELAWLLLPERTDLDQADDLATVISELSGVAPAQHAQRELLEWLSLNFGNN